MSITPVGKGSLTLSPSKTPQSYQESIHRAMDPDQVFFKVGKTGYYIYEVDAGGYEIESGDIDVVKRIRREIMDLSKGYTDVFIISHGYMTGKAVDGSIGLVNRTVKAMEQIRPNDVLPLYIGVKWPSLPSTFGDKPDESNKSRFDSIVETLRESVTRAVTPSPKVNNVRSTCGVAGHKAIETLSKQDSIYCASRSLESSEAKESMKESLVAVATEIAKQGAMPRDENSIIDDGKTHSAQVLPLVEKLIVKSKEKDSGRGPLFLLQDIVFGQFERRASNVGSRGVHILLADLMRNALPAVRFHLLGHSLGGHVVCSAAIGREPGCLLSRKVHSIVIAQGALDSKSLAPGGQYRPLVANLLPVAGPIVETVFKGDFALGMYDLFHNDPAGHVGFKDIKPVPAVEMKMLDAPGIPDQKFDFRPGKCYNVESGDVISEHLDIHDVEVANLIWSAAAVPVPEEAYRVTDPTSLPANFWKSYAVRAEDDLRGSWCTIM